MKYFLPIACLAGATLALPFAGPWLGLASYQSLAPEQGLRLDVDAGALNVHQRGQGRDVVLVHGQPGSASMMTPLAEALTGVGMRVTWYDRMGWGRSGQRRESEPANPTAHGADLASLISALGLVDPIVVAYSYGGGAAMEALRLVPGASHTLVLLSSVGAPSDPSPETFLQRVFLHPLFMRWLLGTTITARAATAPVMAAFTAPESIDRRASDAFIAGLASWGVPTNWARERRERYQGFTEYRPGQVRACTLIVHGADDQIVPVDVARYLSREIPGAGLVIVPQAGHALPLTRPALVAEYVADHAQRCARRT